MNQEQLKSLPTEELRKKEKGLRTLCWIFVPLTLLLVYFSLEGWLSNGELDLPMFTIAICTLGGLVATWQELRQVGQILRERD